MQSIFIIAATIYCQKLNSLKQHIFIIWHFHGSEIQVQRVSAMSSAQILTDWSHGVTYTDLYLEALRTILSANSLRLLAELISFSCFAHCHLNLQATNSGLVLLKPSTPSDFPLFQPEKDLCFYGLEWLE